MTREQQVALDAMRSAWPEEVVQRMLRAEDGRIEWALIQTDDYSPPETPAATSTHRPQEEPPDSPGGCIRCGASEHEPCDAGLHG